MAHSKVAGFQAPRAGWFWALSDNRAVERFCAGVRTEPFLFNVLMPDETQVLTVIRHWQLDGFEDELIATFRHTWRSAGLYLSKVAEFLGGDDLWNGAMPECFRDVRDFTYKKYPNIDLDELYRLAQAATPVGN